MKRGLLSIFTLFSMSVLGQGIEKGYHGFADLGYGFGTSQLGASVVEIATSHGYQFNPYFYLGAGAAFDFTGRAEWDEIAGKPFNKRDSKVDIPLFFNARVSFAKSVLCPFADVRIGATITDNADMYMNFSVGCRYKIKDNIGLSLSLGYQMRKLTAEELHIISGDKYNNYASTFYYSDLDREFDDVMIKVGFDF